MLYMLSRTLGNGHDRVYYTQRRMLHKFPDMLLQELRHSSCFEQLLVTRGYRYQHNPGRVEYNSPYVQHVLLSDRHQNNDYKQEYNLSVVAVPFDP